MNLKIYEKTKYNNIYKHRKNGAYAIDLSLGYDSLGKRVRTTKTGILTEKEAKKILADEDLKRKSKNLIINVSKFEDSLDEYFEWCLLSGTVRETTLKKKRCRFNNHITPFFEGMKLEKIGETEILKWHQHLDSTELSIDTKNTLHNQLSAYFNWLLIHKRAINFNPCRAVPNFKIPKKQINYRTLEEMQILWDAIENDDKKSEETKLRTYAITKGLFFSGFRPGELLGIKIKNIDFDILNKDEIDTEVIRIVLEETIYYDSNGWVKSKGKTEDSLGSIFVGKNAFQPIFDYIKYMNSIGYIFEEDDYIFTNPNSDKEINVYSLETIRKDINYFVSKTGLAHTRPKDMRSSHGTFLLNNGFSLEEVQTRLRHTRKTTTEKFYATFYDESKKSVAKDIDKYA